MVIEVKKIVVEASPVQVDETPAGDAIYCSCCKDHKALKLALIRGSAFELRTILPGWFASLGAEEIISHAQSESDGNLSVSITYR